MKQAPLFDPPPKFQAHSVTSKNAARGIERSARTLRSYVYRYILNSPDGATDDQIQMALRMEGSTERPRRIELQEKNLIKDSGRTRKTRKGREAVVWEAV